MATEPPEGLEADEDVLEVGEPPEQEIPQTEDTPEDDEETVIEIEGDEEASAEPESAPIRQMREKLRERDRRIAELEKSTAPKPIDLGPRPTLESCDYDEEKFASDLEAWHDRKRQADDQTAEQSRATQHQQEEEAKVRARYQANAAKLQAQAKIDPDEYLTNERAVADALPDVVRGVMAKYMPDQAPMLVRILGTRPKKLEEIAGLTDPLAMILALNNLSRDIKVVTKKKSPPPPEERLSGSGAISRQSSDKERERLEKEAARTNDRSKLIAYNASKKAK